MILPGVIDLPEVIVCCRHNINNRSVDNQVEADSAVEPDNNQERPTSALAILEALVAVTKADPVVSLAQEAYSLRYWVAVILYRNHKRDEITATQIINDYDLSWSRVRGYSSKDPVSSNFSTSIWKMTDTTESKLHEHDSSVTPASMNFDAVEERRKKN